MNKKKIFDILVKHTCEVIPELKNHNFQLNDSLSDLGANSIDRVEIITMMMETLSLRIPRVELFGTQNLEELVDVLYGKLYSA